MANVKRGKRTNGAGKTYTYIRPFQPFRVLRRRRRFPSRDQDPIYAHDLWQGLHLLLTSQIQNNRQDK